MGIIIPKFLDETLTPVAKETGERLADIINLIFTPLIKAKAVRDKNLELFLKELETDINKIPEDKLRAPKLHIVAPILEDVGKYDNDEEYLRSMFSELIASSLNKECFVHPSYREVIKQLSWYDLTMVKKVVEPYNDEKIDLFYYYKTEPHKFYYIFWNDFYGSGWFNAEFIFEGNDRGNLIENKEKFENSLINLQRLGLINIFDNGVDNSKKICDFDVISIGYHDIEEKQVGSFDIMATPYLVEFMNICCSEKMYNSIE